VNKNWEEEIAQGRWWQKPKCSHSGEKVVWAHEGRELVAADRDGAQVALWDAAAVVDLGRVLVAGPPKAVMHGSDPRFEELEDLIPHPVVLRLDWPDGSVLPAPPAFWRRLWDLLPKGRVLVCCQGGHGRTGTALAALLVVVGGFTAEEALRYVRLTHCPQAVETWEQEDYLNWLGERVKGGEANGRKGGARTRRP